MALEATMDEELDASSVSLETANLRMGSMNFGIFAPPRKFELSLDFLAKARDFMLPYTFATFAGAMRHLGQVQGTTFGFECRDPSHVSMVGHFVDRCLVRCPILSSLHWEAGWRRHLWQKHALVGADAT